MLVLLLAGCAGSGPCAPDASSSVFADDLRAALVGWYDTYGADVEMSGGNTLAQAQAEVSADRAVEVADAADDPHAHDLAAFRVWSHPDVAFPGSDRWWYGAYACDGALEAVYDFE